MIMALFFSKQDIRMKDKWRRLKIPSCDKGKLTNDFLGTVVLYHCNRFVSPALAY